MQIVSQVLRALIFALNYTRFLVVRDTLNPGSDHELRFLADLPPPPSSATRLSLDSRPRLER